MDKMKGRLWAGYAETVITPPLGLGIPGYYLPRPATGIVTDLYLRAIAFSDGEKRALFFSCDCISTRNKGYQDLIEMIAKRTGVDLDSIYIACNHSHTSFRLSAPDQVDDPEFSIYLRQLFFTFCDLAETALEDLKPAKIKAALGEAKGVGYIRRYRMKDGTVKTNPPLGSPDIERFESEHDDSLQLIRIIREGGKEILMVNFGTHADVIGGSRYCSDYSGFMVENLKGAFLGEVEAVFFNGAEGDSNHRSSFFPSDSPLKKGIFPAQRMGRILAGTVLKLYDDAKEIDFDRIASCRRILKFAKNPYDPADVPIAKEMVQIYNEKGPKSPELNEYRINVPEAFRILDNLDRPEFFEFHLTAIRIGQIAFVGIPGEPFQQIGMDIRKESPFPFTLVTSCTNGGEENAYYPTYEAFQQNGYEKSASLFASDCAKVITDCAEQALREITL